MRLVGIDQLFMLTCDYDPATCDAVSAACRLWNLQLVLSRSGEPVCPWPLGAAAIADPRS